jgi:flagellar basal-body rod protein FlgC
MGLFDALDVSGSGLSAERLRMDVTAENLANAQTTKGANGQPYKRKEVVLQEIGGGGFGAALAGAMGAGAQSSSVGGVQVAGIVEDQTPAKQVYDPGHPDANAQGYVSMPNVDPVTEMVDLITASRSYEADVTAMQTAKSMFSKTLELLR